LNAVALALACAIPQQGLGWPQRWRWLLLDSAAPAAAAFLAIIAARAALGPLAPADRTGHGLVVAAAVAAAGLGAVLATPAGRSRLRRALVVLTGRQK
jgi:hypothetical protein